MVKNIELPLKESDILGLDCGDMVYLSGIIYTARDAAHKRLVEQIEKGCELPFDINGQIIYYAGPTPAHDNLVIGAVGPTTSSRMDVYTPLLIEKGLAGMIGKGQRSPQVIDAIKEHKAVYFAAVGGAGALLSRCVTKSVVVAYDDLGTEAIRRLTVKDFPVFVAIDVKGNNIYERKYKKD